jgi:hypothetical protein
VVAHHDDFSPHVSGDAERDQSHNDAQQQQQHHHQQQQHDETSNAQSDADDNNGEGDDEPHSALNTSTASSNADDLDDAEAIRNVAPLLRELRAGAELPANDDDDDNGGSSGGARQRKSSRLAKFTYGEYTARGIRHGLQLASAYASLAHPFTNYTDEFVGCLDYVWYSARRLRARRVLEPVAEDDVRLTCLPCAWAGSDHTPIGVELELLM